MKPRTHRAVSSLAMLLLTCSCVPRQPPEPPRPPPPPAPKALIEEELKPLERPDIVITNIDEQVSQDHKTATVTGTLVNRGNGSTRTVTITVSALDKDGNELDSREAAPSTQHIAPGATATFVSSFERRPGIDHYHVEAISR